MTQITLQWQANGKRRLQKIDGMKTITIGRHPGCDIMLGDPHVSRRHATIFFNGDTFNLHNVSQTNPIVFNDQWSLAHDLKADLQPGDTFTVGRVRIKVGLHATTSDNLGGSTAPELRCLSCGQPLADNKMACPLCRVSINDVQPVLAGHEH